MASKNGKIKRYSRDDYENMIRTGQVNDGFVEGVGYVFWTAKELYFIRVNSSEWYAKPIYEQINSPYFILDRYKTVISKIEYTPHLMSKEELFKLDTALYAELYLTNEPIVNETDAIRVAPKPTSGDLSREKQKSKGKKILETGAAIDDAIGLPLGVVDEFSNSKSLGLAGKILSGIAIVNDISDGEYFSAAGKLILSVSRFGTAIDVGVAIYNTDYMQRKLLRSVLLEIDELNSATTTSWNKENEIKEKLKLLRSKEAEYKSHLGIPKTPNVQPTFTQGKKK